MSFKWYLEYASLAIEPSDEKYFKFAFFYPIRTETFSPDSEVSSNARKLKGLNVRLKSKDDKAIAEVAEWLKEYISNDSILVPMPSSSGSTVSNLAFAKGIVNVMKFNGKATIHIADILTKEQGESSSKRRAEGKRALTAAEIGTRLKTDTLPSKDELKRMILIDNTISTGETVAAAWTALGGKVNVVTFLGPRKGKQAELRSKLARQLGGRKIFKWLKEKK